MTRYFIETVRKKQFGLVGIEGPVREYEESIQETSGRVTQRENLRFTVVTETHWT